MTKSISQLIKIFAFLFISNFLYCPVNAQYSSDSAHIYLLTLSPGTETYAAFGHSALRVSDPHRGIDFVYNYGTFDFSTPNFYPKFVSGKLLYFLSISNYRDFYMDYKMWGQAMWEQKLNLSNKEKWQLITNLQTNYQEENRYYRYGFFRDNCSTRIRDIVEKSVDGTIIYDQHYIKKPQSFRQLCDAYLNKDPWVLLGVNLLLGKGNDSIAGIRDYMYLPAHLMNLFTLAKVSTNGISRNLSQPPEQLFPTTLIFPEPNHFASPDIIFGILFIMVLGFTYLGFKKKKYVKWFDIFLFLVIGLLGLLFLVLLLGTLHKELLRNFNIVWANPVTLIFAIGLLFRKKPLWLLYLLRTYGILLLLFIPVSMLMVQVFPFTAYALMGILVVRIIRIHFATT